MDCLGGYMAVGVDAAHGRFEFFLSDALCGATGGAHCSPGTSPPPFLDLAPPPLGEVNSGVNEGALPHPIGCGFGLGARRDR